MVHELIHVFNVEEGRDAAGVKQARLERSEKLVTVLTLIVFDIEVPARDSLDWCTPIKCGLPIDQEFIDFESKQFKQCMDTYFISGSNMADWVGRLKSGRASGIRELFLYIGCCFLI